VPAARIQQGLARLPVKLAARGFEVNAVQARVNHDGSHQGLTRRKSFLLSE
jgi:hypothetical protein